MLRTTAAASLIACSLVLGGCGGGGGRAPVATPEGGGPATTLPPTPTPPLEPTPSPDPTPQTPQPPPPPPAVSTPPVVSTPPPPPPSSAPPSPPAPPPPDAARFGIQSGDDFDAIERILKSIDADAALKPYLGGHVLSYAIYPGAVAGEVPIRERHGLPATGSDFMDASGAAAVFSGESFRNSFRRDAGRGDGAGWFLAEDIFIYSNWVDGVFFGTSLLTGTRELAPFVLGVPSGVNPDPAGTEETAVWTGPVTGREAGSVINHLDGRATLTYDFGAANLDVVLDQFRQYFGGGPSAEVVSDITWEDLSVSNGSFGDCSGSGNCIRGRFFDDNDGNPAESVGGVFRQGILRGAFGAQRE
ncbi:MAG: hypothetical protein OXG62_00235 [Nitrospinae bacterium]|nr:hypothetical protein [Nitrospinota bacterium]